jgi:hypothetical protein
MNVMSFLWALVLLVAGPGASGAAEKQADPTGRWSWTFELGSGDRIEPTLELRRDGNKLVGRVSARDTEVEIEKGSLAADSTVSFQIEREHEGRTFRARYRGKLAGDVIKGTATLGFDGDERSMPWEARRIK